METFEPYHDIPKVQSLREIVELLSRSLHSQLLREFQLQWLVTDPFAGRHANADSSYDEKQAIRAEQEQVRAARALCWRRRPPRSRRGACDPQSEGASGVRRLQKVREAAPKLESMRDAALMAHALERRTHTRSAIVEDIVAKWINTLQVTRLDLPHDSSVPLDERFQGLFDWLTHTLEGNRYFVEQWKVFPAEWKARSSDAPLHAHGRAAERALRALRGTAGAEAAGGALLRRHQAVYGRGAAGVGGRGRRRRRRA